MMKVIGLVGGMSWNSTLEYYRLMNEGVSRRLSGLHSARLVLYSVDFEDIERAQHEAHLYLLALVMYLTQCSIRHGSTLKLP